ncbi:uncharacterized protein [Cherax quadricarinatus]|uniref:uncharacterized protein n=1 Tax=Cherax quadricarinatus TaxID=27406 RepID=UPI00387E98E4
MASTPNQQIQILMLEKKSPPSTNNTTNPMTFFFANIQGLKPATNNKIPFIRGLLAEAKAMFAAFTETHIKDHLDNEIWIPGYNLYRCDRVNRQKGGVGLYIEESLVCTELLNASNDVVEVLAVKVENQNLVIVVVYKPPDATSQQFQEQLLKIDHCLENLPARAPNILLLGYFNLRHLKRRNIANNIVAVITPGGSSDENSHSHELLNLCTKFNLNQQIIEPTRLENTLDLIFTNNDDLIRNVTISNTIYSNHNIIEVQTCMRGAPDRHNETSHEGAFTKFNFNKKTKWDQVSLPAHIRGITNRPLAVFKLALDKHLKSVPDQPGCGSYVGLRAASSNSLVDQALIHQEAWSQTGPRGALTPGTLSR